MGADLTCHVHRLGPQTVSPFLQTLCHCSPRPASSMRSTFPGPCVASPVQHVQGGLLGEPVSLASGLRTKSCSVVHNRHTLLACVCKSPFSLSSRRSHTLLSTFPNPPSITQRPPTSRTPSLPTQHNAIGSERHLCVTRSHTHAGISSEPWCDDSNRPLGLGSNKRILCRKRHLCDHLSAIFWEFNRRLYKN